MKYEVGAGFDRQEREALAKGEQMQEDIRQCLVDIKDILAHNEELEPRDITLVVDDSLEIEVRPVEPVSYRTRHLARPDSSATLATREPFELVRATAVPVVHGDQSVSLVMYGNGRLSELGDFAVYELDPLAGHDFAVTRARESDATGRNYGSGVAVRRLADSNRLFFILY